MKTLLNFIEELKIDYTLTDNIIQINSHKFHIAYWDMEKTQSNNKKDDQTISKLQYDLTEDKEKLGEHIVHIWQCEWDDLTKQKIWKSVIKHKLGLTEFRIPARKCKVVEISNKDASDFCYRNHLQGKSTGGKCLALMHQGDIVMVAIIAKPRYSKQFNYELLRLCSRLNTIVIGGASKILKEYSNLVSYANRRWSVGGVYKSSGFRYHQTSGTCYWYLQPDNIMLYNHRQKYQKHKLQKQLKVFDESKSEVENMYENNFRRIWDCGNLIFVKD